MHNLTKKELTLLAGLSLLLIPALLINLGLPPLYGEEPRRAVVAIEMLLRGNYIVPTIHGEFYFLKPPVYNWIIASVYQLTGNPTEFYTRLTTVVSLLLLGVVIFLTGKKYVSNTFGALSSLLFVTSSGNLFFNSLLAEIDMFYSLVTFTGLICLFHFHQKKKYIPMFLIVYFLGAVGFLTKGMPSLLYTGLSLLVFLMVQKEWRKLFHWAHFAGILIFSMIVGGYFIIYFKQGDALHYLFNLSVESGKRFSGDTFWDYLWHMVLYPLDTLMNLLPASILIIFTFRRSFLRIIRGNSLMKFALLILIIHFPVYWLPPGGRQRYIIMLYPFIIQIITYFFLLSFQSKKKISVFLQRIITISIGLGALMCLAPLVIELPVSIPYLLWICLVAFLVMMTIFFFQLKFPPSSIITLLFALVVLRILFDLVVLPARSKEGNTPVNKATAIKIAEITRGAQAGIFHTTYFPMQSVFYLERARMEILPVYREVRHGSFHIVEKIILEDYRVHRDIGIMHHNPLKPSSDPFTGNDRALFAENEYQVYLDFILQKRKYLLLMPFHRHP